jgi:hypothetical protein
MAKYNAVFLLPKLLKKQIQITFIGNGVVNMDMISLFPQDTWKGRKGGLEKIWFKNYMIYSRDFYVFLAVVL